MITYLIGSISWGYLFVNLTMGEDIRDFGSGRTGHGPNILRTSGGKAAALVFLLDAGKGVLCVVLARTVIGSGEAEGSRGAAGVVRTQLAYIPAVPRGGAASFPGLAHCR